MAKASSTSPPDPADRQHQARSTPASASPTWPSRPSVSYVADVQKRVADVQKTSPASRRSPSVLRDRAEGRRRPEGR